jgi:hypothetical protein
MIVNKSTKSIKGTISPLTLTHLTQKKDHDVGNPGFGTGTKM